MRLVTVMTVVVAVDAAGTAAVAAASTSLRVKGISLNIRKQNKTSKH